MTRNIDPGVDDAGRRAVEELMSDATVASVQYLASTDSTNTLALSEIRQGGSPASELAELPRLYLTDRQTAGRGRHGRTWVSDQSTLTFTLVIDPSPGLDTEKVAKVLSVAVGVGVARAIEFVLAPLQTQLKWPTDVYAGGGKVAGILLETSPSAAKLVVVGVGVNISAAPDLSAEANPNPVCSLTQASGRLMARYDLLPTMVREILAAVSSSSQEVIDEFRRRCLLSGQTIQYQLGEATSEAKCLGISDAGELIVESDQGQRVLRSGEASLVRRAL
ncbi:MAG: biotin--[acetyl-CoA-carboxylase] ligase [Rubripirellula sp.]